MRDRPDFAVLFADNAAANADRSWTLSPRTAYALWEAADNLCFNASEDISDFGSTPVQPDDGLWWRVFDRYPPTTWNQDDLWREYAAVASQDLAGALAAGDWPMPQTAAEEMALWLTIEDAENRVNELYDFLAEDLEAFPAHKNDYTWEDCRDYLFYDHDILFLFDQTLEDIGDPDSFLHETVPDVADYRPQSWFDPFWGSPPRNKERESYQAAVARRAQSCEYRTPKQRPADPGA